MLAAFPKERIVVGIKLSDKKTQTTKNVVAEKSWKENHILIKRAADHQYDHYLAVS